MSMTAAPGWYPNPSGLGQRHWDGHDWGKVVEGTLSPEERSAALDSALIRWSGRSSRVVARTPYQAVTVIGSPPNHVLHALLTLFLCGLWAPIWLIVGLTQSQRRVELSVDEFGNLTTR
jgi:hypothetical protein